MRLDKITEDCGICARYGEGNPEITAICSDSRKVVPGALFIAVKGFANDGHKYIGTAVEKGAAAIVYEDSAAAESRKDGIVYIRVGSSRHALAMIADAFYGHPSQKLTLVGITGTNGKTTTVTLLHRLFTGLGYHCGLLSTIANYIGEKKSETANTTADPITPAPLGPKACINK